MAIGIVGRVCSCLEFAGETGRGKEELLFFKGSCGGGVVILLGCEIVRL